MSHAEALRDCGPSIILRLPLPVVVVHVHCTSAELALMLEALPRIATSK